MDNDLICNTQFIEDFKRLVSAIDEALSSIGKAFYDAGVLLEE